MAEIEFREWTTEGVMRAPSFKGLRDDKSPRDVVLEARPDAGTSAERRRGAGDSPEALFDEVEALPEGALAVVTEGRRLKIIQLGQGPVSGDRVHEGRPDRVLRARSHRWCCRICATGR